MKSANLHGLYAERTITTEARHSKIDSGNWGIVWILDDQILSSAWLLSHNSLVCET